MFLSSKLGKSFVFLVAALLLGSSSRSAHAQATLLLEEPYSYDGTFAGTGHAAVYLARVCAETPTLLRRCNPGESGVVISRYHHLEGRDWVAVPLLPYLYAVDNPGNVPLYADAKLVSFLRHQYLEKIDISGPDSYQVVGSAYDRTTYGFRIETTPEQDDALIGKLNAEKNRDIHTCFPANTFHRLQQHPPTPHLIPATLLRIVTNSELPAWNPRLRHLNPKWRNSGVYSPNLLANSSSRNPRNQRWI